MAKCERSRISVVTPCLNMSRYLESTIVSVIENLGPHDEYFIVDGGSTDGSIDIIRRYEANLSGWVSESDNGYADGLAKGFARTNGDILCWLNASDLYLTGALDAARQLLIESRLDMIFGDDFYIDVDSNVLSYSRGWVPDLQRAMLFGGWTPLQDACFWRRDLYEKVGGIDPSLQYAADYDLFLRMALNGTVRYVPFAFSAFRKHVGQKSIAGSVSYEEERNRVRIREVNDAGIKLMRRAAYRSLNRVAMSARSRLAPLIWRRDDLVGQPITSLPAACYWPAETRREHV